MIVNVLQRIYVKFMLAEYLSKRIIPSGLVTFVDMDRVTWKKTPNAVAGAALLLLAALICAWLLGRNAYAGQAPVDHFSEKVNLALRRTGHYLLAETGDTSSRIAAVRQKDANTWLLQLEHSFNYDRLPVLLQQSLEIHGIRENYDVAVVNCLDGALQLGYNFLDFKQNNGAPCGGREMLLDCYNLEVHFVKTTPPKSEKHVLGWIVAVAGLLTGIFLVARNRRKIQPNVVPETEMAFSGQVLFGNSRLDPGNQTLISGASHHTLTYREAKLLHLFASHPNQLLERDFILQSVWEDEGIIVGRSVDVFVSRLRKLLRDDPGVRIVAVHGVGYRMET